MEYTRKRLTARFALLQATRDGEIDLADLAKGIVDEKTQAFLKENGIRLTQ